MVSQPKQNEIVRESKKKNERIKKCICKQKTHFVSDGEKIYVIPDAPHGWKYIKCNWMRDPDTW